jgi:hypothetical protein
VKAAFAARVSSLGAPFAARLATFREQRAAGALGICETSAEAPKASRCCCAERLPCFNMTGHERRYREPPSCMPGERRMHELVASDMPLGWCCTWRAPRKALLRQPRKAMRRRQCENHARRGKAWVCLD